MNRDMNRTIKIASGALIVGVALIWLGVWRTSPPALLSDVALPNTWTGQTLEREGVSVALNVRPLASVMVPLIMIGNSGKLLFLKKFFAA